VDRFIDVNDQPVTHSIGWPERSGDGTFWHPKERIQQLISSGLRFQTAPGETETEGLGPHEELSEAWEAAGVGEPTPRVSVQVRPIQSSKSFDDFYGADFQNLRQWRPLRPAGFGFDLGWHPPEPRGTRFVASDNESALVLSRTGVLTLASSFTSPVFLWGSQPPDLAVNPFALTEWVAEGIRLAYHFVGPRLDPARWTISVDAEDLLGDPPVRIRQPSSAWLRLNASRPATVQSVNFGEEGTGNWEADSYRVLVELVGEVFGLPAAWVFGVDHEAKKADLRSIDRFRE
jgi:hypothetical protein